MSHASPLLIALDQGTTSSRSIVFDANGRIVTLAQQEFTQHFPQSGWVEHDPNEIWDSQLKTLQRVVAQLGEQSSNVAALGITNQRETLVLWDRQSGQAVHRAIVWQDRRGESLCAELRARGVEADLTRRTGLRLDAYFTATKLAWVLQQHPELAMRAQRGELCAGTIDSWLLWKLTAGQVHATDVSNASRTLLMNLQTSDWDPTLLDLFGVPAGLLPRIQPSASVYGTVQAPELAKLAGCHISGVAGDQQSALFGQACFSGGLAKNTYGTGCFLLVQGGTQRVDSSHGLLTTAAATVQGQSTQYALEGSVFVGGAIVQWLRDGLGAIESSAAVEALATQVPDSGGVIVVPALTGLGAPYWKPNARGSILGLSRGTTMAHIARACVESIAYQSAALLRATDADLRATGLPPLRELRVDGGASRNDLLMQFQADLLGIPVVRPKITETTALGAAWLAGLAVGLWPNTQSLENLWQAERRFEPQMDRVKAEAHMQLWEHAVRQTCLAEQDAS